MTAASPAGLQGAGLRAGCRRHSPTLLFSARGKDLKAQHEQKARERELQRVTLPLSAFTNPTCEIMDEKTVVVHAQPDSSRPSGGQCPPHGPGRHSRRLELPTMGRSLLQRLVTTYPRPYSWEELRLSIVVETPLFLFEPEDRNRWPCGLRARLGSVLQGSLLHTVEQGFSHGWGQQQPRSSAVTGASCAPETQTRDVTGGSPSSPVLHCKVAPSLSLPRARCGSEWQATFTVLVT